MESELSVAASMLGGVMVFLSPCFLPLVPSYLLFLIGDEPHAGRSRGRALSRSVVFALGFTIVFVALGALSGSLGAVMITHRSLVNRAVGCFMVLFGLLLLLTEAARVGWLRGSAGSLVYRLHLGGSARVSVRYRGTYLGAFLLGAAFSLIAAGSCGAPILFAILAYAGTAGRALRGALLLLAFSAGVALPFILSAAFVGSVVGYVKRALRYSTVFAVAGGLLLVLLGIAVFLDQLWRLNLIII